jgi:hypothetical protein
MKRWPLVLLALLVSAPALAGERPTIITKIVYRDTCSMAAPARPPAHHSRRAQSKRRAIGGRAAETARRDVICNVAGPAKVGRSDERGSLSPVTAGPAFSSSSRADGSTEPRSMIPGLRQSARTSLGRLFVNALELRFGARWDRGSVCPDCPACAPPPPPRPSGCDPIYLGPGLSFEINRLWTVRFGLDLDLDGDHAGQIGRYGAELALHPWRQQ